MDAFRRSRTVRSCSAGRPKSGGYSRRNRTTSLRCLQCAGAVCFVNREAAARPILPRSTSVITITELLWPSGASRTPADAPNCTRGWLARLAATRTKKVGFGTLSSRRKSENRTKARRLRPANAGPNTPPRKPEYRPARGRARGLLSRVYSRTEKVSDVSCLSRGLRRAPASDEAPR